MHQVSYAKIVGTAIEEIAPEIFTGMTLREAITGDLAENLVIKILLDRENMEQALCYFCQNKKTATSLKKKTPFVLTFEELLAKGTHLDELIPAPEGDNA